MIDTIDTIDTPARARTIGATARALLAASGGRIGSVPGSPGFADSPYRLAGDGIVWIGTQPRIGHPRMVALDAMPAPGAVIDFAQAALWCPPTFQADPVRLVRNARHLRGSLTAVGGIGVAPRGFAAALAGLPLAFPLDLAAARLDAFLNAGDDDFVDAAGRLLGVGGGLTPSGDDLVSAFLFGRRLIDPDGWHARAQSLIGLAAARTHAISAALFADTARGQSYGVLHNLAAALNRGGRYGDIDDAVLDAARALTAVGHSSGWDLLAGLLYALTL